MNHTQSEMEAAPTVAPVTAHEDEKQHLPEEAPQKSTVTANIVPVTPKSPSIVPDRRSSVAPGAKFGIYWRSPITMVAIFLLGLGSALALHGYYSSLNGKRVGNTNQQQTALRVGTTLAFITQISLVGSVHYAYVQTLWRALKSNVISIYAVDAGFAATSSLLSFTNWEMISKLRQASFLAMIAWCIPISSLITPATLNVDSILQQSGEMMNVPELHISQAGEYQDFAYYVSRTNSTLQKYLGPRTIMTRLTVATSTTGQILPLPVPRTNASYVQIFFGPYVQCVDANQSVISEIDAANERRAAAIDPSIKELANDYFAFVPALSNLNESSRNPIQVANLTDVNGALYASNQLWLTFPRYNSDNINFNVSQVPDLHYLTCELHNASYQVNFTWTNGIQLLDILDLDVLDATPYPIDPSYSSTDEVAMAYSAFMWALSSQLTGTMGFYQDVSNNDTNNQIIANRTYSEIATNIDQISLLGTSDLNSYFIKNHFLTNNNVNQPFSSQRLQDMALARNRTLDVLIPELSSNITLGLLTNSILSPFQPTNVTTTTPTNIYIYEPDNVFIAYGIAIMFSLLANILGMLAYIVNKVSHDNNWSSIFCTTKGLHVNKLNAHEKLGALPLEKRIGRTKVRFDVGDMIEGEAGHGHWGFRLADES